jgi:chromosome segregation ATPase
MRTSTRPVVFGTIVVASLIALGGCQASGPARLDTATASVAETNRLLTQGGGSVDAVLAAMNRLEAGPELRTRFDEFSRSIDELDRAAERVRARNAAMQARAADHTKAWEAELAKVGSETARSVGEERRAAFAQRFANVQAEMRDLKDAFDPFMDDLRDLRLILANELNADGLAASASLIEAARSKAGEVRRAISETSASLDMLEQQLRG